MAKVAEFPDIEDWLTVVLTPGVPVASKVPATRPPEFVRAFRSGGPGRSNRVSETATMVIEAYAGTETRALQILRDCSSQIAELEGTTTEGLHLKKVTESSGPGNLPHPTIPGFRYTQTFDLTVKGATS